jgi:hypothetical protein
MASPEAREVMEWEFEESFSRQPQLLEGTVRTDRLTNVIVYRSYMPTEKESSIVQRSRAGTEHLSRR